MSRKIFFALALVMLLSLCACGGKSKNMIETEDDKDYIIASASTVYNDVKENEARAMQNSYEVTGSIDSISAEYCMIDNLRIYLSTDTLVSLNKGDLITIHGTISEVETESKPVGLGTSEITIIVFKDAILTESVAGDTSAMPDGGYTTVGEEYSADDLEELALGDYLGAEVGNYFPSNSANVNWKIFYAGSIGEEDPHIYLIASDYISTDNLPENAPLGKLFEYKFSIGKNDIYEAGTDWITDERMKNLMPAYFEKLERAPKHSNDSRGVIRSLAVLDFDVWNGFTDEAGNAEYAMGGPTYELFAASYNQKHFPQLSVYLPSTNGYNCSTKTKSDNWLDVKDNLYVIASDEKANSYWLASPAYNEDGDNFVMNVTYFGAITSAGKDNVSGFRPVVCLNPSVKLEKEADGTYTIIE